MSQSSSIADKGKPTRTKHRPRRASNLKASGHSANDNMVPMAIRVELDQRVRLDALAKGLMIHKADLIRKGIEFVLGWGEERLKKLTP